MQLRLHDREDMSFVPGTGYIEVNSVIWLNTTEEVINWASPSGKSGRLRFYDESNKFSSDTLNSITKEYYPKILSLLQEERAKLKEVIFPEGVEDKIAKIKFVRERYSIGLREAKELVDMEVQKRLRAWYLPKVPDLSMDSTFSTYTNEDELVYVESWGIIPKTLLDQVDYIDYVDVIEAEEFQPKEYILLPIGIIKAYSSRIKLTYWKGKLESFEFIEGEISDHPDRIGTYSDLSIAMECYRTYRLGYQVATNKFRQSAINWLEDFTN